MGVPCAPMSREQKALSPALVTMVLLLLKGPYIDQLTQVVQELQERPPESSEHRLGTFQQLK